MGMQKAGVLLGVRGDDMIDSSDTCARARRILTPQQEYPIFTPGIRESVLLPPSSEQGRPSFQDSDGQGVWKEIHTDSQSTLGQHSRTVSVGTGRILTPSMSATSLDQQHSGPLQQHSGPLVKPSSRHHSPRPEYMENPAVLMSPSSHGAMLPGSRLTMSSGGNNYYVSVPNTPDQRNYNITGRGRASPRTTMPHSPQNINILSPHLRPLEKSPKLTQLHISSPRLTEQGGMTSVVNQLTLSPELGSRPAYDQLIDTRVLANNMLPPASSDDQRQVTMASPVLGSLSTTLRLKKLMKYRQAEQSPRPSVSKETRSPGRSWKKPFRAASPLASIRGEQQNPARGLSKDINNSFQASNARGNAAVNSSSLPSWRGYGDGEQAGIGPAFDWGISQEFPAGDFERPDPPQKVGGKKVASTQKSGTYNIFGFLNWGKKKSSSRSEAAAAQRLNDSFQSDMGASVLGDTDSIKVLDHTIKTLRYKLEQANQKCLEAEEEVRALQAAAVASDENCRLLTQQCQDLELQLSARRSGLGHWDGLELEESDSATYIVGTRAAAPAIEPPRRFSSQELTPEQFLKVFEESQACIRKLASAICHHVRDSGESATQVITSLLEQHKVGRSISRMPRNVIILYFESFLNQVMFESFENVSFEPNGAASVFDPDTLKQTRYQSYQSLKSQEWNSIEKSLGKPGAFVVNASFHRFFVVRMELILSQLGKLAESEVSLSLMSSFFNAVKAVWLVHHLAFAFDQPVSIFRVSPAAEFDPRFMEQIPAFEEEPVRSKVSIMVNPGFIVNRQTIKCQVFCSSTYQ